MKIRTAVSSVILVLAGLSLAGCTSTGNQHVYQGQPVGGFVQEHGGNNPEPVVIPQYSGY